MNSKLVSFPFTLVVGCFMVGCSGSVDSLESTWTGGEDDSALLGAADPAIESVIYTNSLDPEALAPSDLGRYPLSIAGMSPATAALVTGPNGSLVRKLLKHAVGCALDAQAKFNFTWIDSMGTTRQESYAGGTGLASAWPSRALDVAEQEWVSACLAARVNWYGEAVKISMRGSASALNSNTPEGAVYSKREGAFMGNLFSVTPFLRACYDSNNVEFSRKEHRDCAVGHVENGSVLECGIIGITDSCQNTCLAPVGAGYYPSCSFTFDALSGSAQTQRVITVFLH